MERFVRPIFVVGVIVSLLLVPNLGRAQGPAPSGADANAPIQSAINNFEDLHTHLKDFDSRTVNIQPTTQQLSTASALGADSATWTRFGTAATLFNYDGYLGPNLAGEPAAAAREWVRANRGLFRLSDAAVTNLELVNDVTADDTDGHSVLFRQRFGSLKPFQDGLISVAIVGGNVVHAWSSATGDVAAPSAVTLTAQQAWLKAADNVGRTLNLANISGVRTEDEWRVFKVAGFSYPGRARLRAFPTAAGKARGGDRKSVV